MIMTMEVDIKRWTAKLYGFSPFGQRNNHYPTKRLSGARHLGAGNSKNSALLMHFNQHASLEFSVSEFVENYTHESFNERRRSKSKCNNFLNEIVYAKNLPTPPT
jgi:hypothetical protein